MSLTDELPGLTKIESIALGPDDVLVLSFDELLSDEIKARIGLVVKLNLGIPNKVLVLEKGATVSVVRQ